MKDFAPGVQAIIKSDSLSQNLGRTVTLVYPDNTINVSYVDHMGNDWHVHNPDRLMHWVVEGEIDVMDEATGLVTTDKIYAYPQSALMLIDGYEPVVDDRIEQHRNVQLNISRARFMLKHYYQFMG